MFAPFRLTPLRTILLPECRALACMRAVGPGEFPAHVCSDRHWEYVSNIRTKLYFAFPFFVPRAGLTVISNPHEVLKRFRYFAVLQQVAAPYPTIRNIA
jgi:hypothetical protein